MVCDLQQSEQPLRTQGFAMPRKITTSATDFLPGCTSLRSLRAASARCEGCELYQHATQTVFGRGTRGATVMLVGEMPGDQEDLQGKPFVGPAGKLLNEMLAEAGLGRDDVYVTNIVKHFRWQERGKRRLHKKPAQRHIEACRPWLDAEIFVVRPQLIVCLGATAAQALLGKEFRVTHQHGKVIERDFLPPIMATYHPAAILRVPDDEARHEVRSAFVQDLTHAQAYLSTLANH